MQFLNKWERKLGWLSFPGFLRYFAILNVLVYLLQFVSPEIGLFLMFDRSKIFTGEVWRLVTFIFADAGVCGLGVPQAISLYFMVMIAFMMSDGLEGAWGVFRTSMFYYTGFVALLVANFLYDYLGIPIHSSGILFYSSAFFAFATLFPKVELLVMMLIPVQVRWLALLSAFYSINMIYRLHFIFGYLPLVGCLLIGLVNYLLWAGIPAIFEQSSIIKTANRRRRFEKEASMDENAFHRCAVCERTDISDPDLEFRMTADGKEYCTDHLKD